VDEGEPPDCLYQYARNPMYVGVLLALVGESLLLESSSFLLYNEPRDPPTLIGGVVVLATVATMAAWVPASAGVADRSGGGVARELNRATRRNRS
jgi:hypothetical protein